MNYTLLQLTQAVLSSLDSDEITAITDTTESQQVVKIIRSVYYDILARANLPEHYSLFTLTAGANGTPTLFTLPTDVDSMLWLKYDLATVTDADKQFSPMIFQPLEAFLSNMHALDESATNVDTYSYTDGSKSFSVLYLNDKPPAYYTVYGDNVIILDSIDLTVDTTRLTAAKTLAYGKLIITFTESDSFAFDLDEAQMALLLNESKALAWAELRQTTHQKAEVNARRGWTGLQNTKYRTTYQTLFDRLPNYGRK